MTKGLLDLPDDVLNHIANEVHQDSHIPLPSLNPHFENFISAINPENNPNFMTFRQVCKQIYEVVPAKGLHVTVHCWDELLAWNSRPQYSITGIRRLSVHIWPPDVYARRSNTEHYDAISRWNILTDFLSSLTGLEELTIEDLGLCFHKRGFNFLKYLTIPENDFLLKVTLLAFEVRCLCCSRHMPKLFVPAAPKLKHLKLIRSTGNSTRLSKIMNTWSSRHSDQICQLVSLYVKSMNDGQPLKALAKIGEACPTIRNLYFCSTPWQDSSTLFPRISLVLPTIAPASEEDSKSLKSITVFEDIFDYSTLNEALISKQSLTEVLLNALSRFNNLTTLDCYLEANWDSRSSEIEYASRHHTKAQYQAGTYVGQVTSPRAERHKQAMVECAELLVHHLPSLKSGYFWSSEADVEDGDLGCYRRWRWDTITSSGHPPQVILPPNPHRYSVDFTRNMDEIDQSTYVSDIEDDT